MQFFEYFEKDSILHRVNPSLKLILIMVLMFAVTFAYDPYTPLIFAVIAVLQLTILGKIPLKSIFKMVLPLSFILFAITITSIIAFNTAAETSPVVVISVGSFIITKASITFGVTIGLRIFCFLLYSILFVATTDPTDFILSLILQLKLNPKIGFGTLAGYRFVPLLSSEYKNIHQAHIIRGAREHKGMVARIKRIKKYAVPLLVGAVRKAQRVAIAMESKSFGSYRDRTYLRQIEIKKSDIIYVTLNILIFAAILAILTINGITVWGYKSIR
ncbi:MAG: energy-coupling factor transporter transmembrane component T family protein [Actinomycetota bacterium]